MRNFREDKITKRNLNEMLNPELNISEPGSKAKPRSGLMAEKVSVPDADTVREGLTRDDNVSKKSSSEKDSDNLLATVGGWMEAIAALDEAPELSEKKQELGIKPMQSTSSTNGEDSKTPSNLVEFVMEYEKFSSTAYDDFKQISIGYGTKASSKNQTITETEAKKLLEKDLDAARKTVLKLKETAGYDWNENQVDALTSFTYNLGAGNLRKLTENGTRGDEEIADMLPEYKYAGGKVRDGLIKRRAAELKLFNEGY
jgi:lysozyme